MCNTDFVNIVAYIEWLTYCRWHLCINFLHFLSRYYCILIHISLKFVLKGPINKTSIIGSFWCMGIEHVTGISSTNNDPVHWCTYVTRPQWVKRPLYSHEVQLEHTDNIFVTSNFSISIFYCMMKCISYYMCLLHYSYYCQELITGGII